MISIIMPVYNTPEDQFETAIKSIISQTYTDFELIIVDDGSKTEIASLCDRMAEKDGRIHTFHQKNQGVSAARNNGTAKSSGNYIMYMDADDVLYENALNECAYAIEKTNADYIFAGIKKIINESELLGIDHKAEVELSLYDRSKMVDLKRSFLGQNNHAFQNVFGGGVVNRGPCARAVNASIAKAVRFDDSLKIGEDVVWNMQVLNSISSACFVNSVWYGYITHSESAINKYYGNRAEILGTYLTKLYENDKAFCDRFEREYMSNMVSTFHTVLSHDFMSASCPLSKRDKRKAVRAIMKSSPWCKMKNRAFFRKLSLKHKILVFSSYAGIVFPLLRMLKI